MKKNILVTGGAGYIGSHTVVELVSAGYKPIIVDDLSNSESFIIERLEKITGQSIKFFKHDFRDEKFLSDLMKSENIGGVIHFAANKAVGESVENPLKYYQNNVAGFISLLTVMAKTKVPHLVFSSSCTVYGQPDKLPITEESPVQPAFSPYGATKQMCEIILSDFTDANKISNAIALRYFNPIGAHPSGLIGELPKGIPSNLVPFITQSVAGERGKLTVHGNDYPTPDGTCIRDYIHVVDLAKAHVKALDYLSENPKNRYTVCNLGTGQGSSVLEVIQTFESATGKKVDYEIGPRRAGDVTQVYAAVERAKKILNWQTEKSLKEALADSWRWQERLKKRN